MERVRTPPRLPPRPADAHKVSVGRVLVVGGSRDLCGAPAMAGRGALRAGAGLVRIAVPRSIQATVAGFQPEATTAALPETKTGALAKGAVEAIADLLDDQDALVLGPGAGRRGGTLEVLRRVAREADLPLVLDADGLFAFRGKPGALARRGAPTVLTPHAGEAGRLLDRPSTDVLADRRSAAASIAKTARGICVLKGPGTLVTDGERLYENRTGGPLLATGGTGDVLAGVVGAFLAAGLDAFDAACCAVHVHGVAGDRLATQGDRGVLATEIADALPAAIGAHLGAPPSFPSGGGA